VEKRGWTIHVDNNMAADDDVEHSLMASLAQLCFTSSPRRIHKTIKYNLTYPFVKHKHR